jgi:hypothetical protein
LSLTPRQRTGQEIGEIRRICTARFRLRENILPLDDGSGERIYQDLPSGGFVGAQAYAPCQMIGVFETRYEKLRRVFQAARKPHRFPCESFSGAHRNAGRETRRLRLGKEPAMNCVELSRRIDFGAHIPAKHRYAPKLLAKAHARVAAFVAVHGAERKLLRRVAQAEEIAEIGEELPRGCFRRAAP